MPAAFGHQVVGVFDAAIVGPAAQFGILADAIELEQPVLETGRGIELAAAYLIGLRVPGDDGLGARAAGAGADPDDVGQCCLGLNIADGRHERPCARLHQVFSSRGSALSRWAPRAGLNFQRAHAALAHVGQAVERGDGTFLDTLGGSSRRRSGHCRSRRAAHRPAGRAGACSSARTARERQSWVADRQAAWSAGPVRCRCAARPDHRRRRNSPGEDRAPPRQHAGPRCGPR